MERMQRIARTILSAVIFGAVNLFAQAQDSVSSPQKLATDQTSGVTVPVLTIDQAVALGVKENRQVRSTALGVDAAQQETAALRTSRWPQFQTYLLGGEPLRPISLTIPEGALGVYPATGPIPP